VRFLNVKLYHFSEDPGIATFIPRTPEHRPEIEPMVWTVDQERAWTYLFPRDCPRVLLWPTAATTPDDLAHWFGGNPGARIACIEWRWLKAMHETSLFRYEMDPGRFRPLDGDSWMHVSRQPETPVALEPVGDLVAALQREGVELRLMPTLGTLFGAWEHSFHFSGIRLRNAVGWPEVAEPGKVRVQ
jgi:hypothetical protein